MERRLLTVLPAIAVFALTDPSHTDSSVWWERVVWPERQGTGVRCGAASRQAPARRSTSGALRKSLRRRACKATRSSGCGWPGARILSSSAKAAEVAASSQAVPALPHEGHPGQEDFEHEAEAVLL